LIKSNLNRRSFLLESGKLASASWLAMNTPMLLAAGQSAETHRESGEDWQNISPAEAITFAAIVDQIIPPDDMPGASDAGVVYFIDNVLGGFMAGASGMLKQGLADLDASAIAAYPDQAGFAALDFDQQTEILTQVETTPFFNTMIKIRLSAISQ